MKRAHSGFWAPATAFLLVGLPATARGAETPPRACEDDPAPDDATSLAGARGGTDTGRLPTYGRFSFDRVRFGVHSDPGSKFPGDAQRQAMLLRGANGPKYVVSAAVDNVVVKYFDR